jgi:hypothetical protein
MKSKHNLLNSCLEKYEKGRFRILRAVKDGRFSAFSPERKQYLLRRLARYERKLRGWGIAITTATAMLLPGAGMFGQTPQGTEFRVNDYTNNHQDFPAMAMDGNGNFVVSWESYGQDGSNWGVYARRFNNDGVSVGNEFKVNTYTAANQWKSAAAMDADGDFVIVWESVNQDGSGYGIYGQRYNNAGTPQGVEFRVNTTTTNSQRDPAIAMDADGDFVVTWASMNQDGQQWGVYARRYNNAGEPQSGEFLVNTYVASDQEKPAIAMDADGNFVITWESYGQDGTSEGIYAQRFTNSGAAQGNEFMVSSHMTGIEAIPSVAMDSQGDFVVTWMSWFQDGYTWGVFAQRYNFLGMAQGGEFLVNNFTSNHQYYPAVAMDNDGDFVITWASKYQDGSYYGVYARRYNGGGMAQGSEFRVNTYTSANQRHQTIAMDADGDYVIAWTSFGQDGWYDGVYAQRYATPCTPLNWYADADDDGYGAGSPTLSCTQPAGTSTLNTDCDDSNNAINPSATEVPGDEIDQNCDNAEVCFLDQDDDSYRPGLGSVTLSSADMDCDDSGEALVGDPAGDCDDSNGAVNPGAMESCNGVDDDCDGIADNGLTFTTFYNDEDGDGYGTGSPSVFCSDPGTGYVQNNTDCNDVSAAINPGATEVCNFLDDNCNSSTDEGFPVNTYYQDLDGDGQGNPAVSTTACTQPPGYVLYANDCNDFSTTACPKPFGLNTTNITDNSATASWTALLCADQYRFEYRRRSSPVQTVWTVIYTTDNFYTFPGNLSPNGVLYQWRVAAICTPGVTSAQSGYAPPVQYFNTSFRVYADADGDGFGATGAIPVFVSTIPQPGLSANDSDCDDTQNTTYPGAMEICNGLDDDCDGSIDEGGNWYPDADGDGLGNPLGLVINYCEQPQGYVGNNRDCDDSEVTVICSVPTGVNVSELGSTNATVSWAGTICASAYNVMYRLPNLTWSVPVTTTGTSLQLNGLLPATTYLARVRARCPSPNPATISTWVYFTFTTIQGTQLTVETGWPDVQPPLNDQVFDIYPNPAGGLVNLRISSETDGEADVIVTDVSGREVYAVRQPVFEGLTIAQLDLTGLGGGVYQVHIRCGEMNSSKKIVLMK